DEEVPTLRGDEARVRVRAALRGEIPGLVLYRLPAREGSRKQPAPCGGQAQAAGLSCASRMRVLCVLSRARRASGGEARSRRLGNRKTQPRPSGSRTPAHGATARASGREVRRLPGAATAREGV